MRITLAVLGMLVCGLALAQQRPLPAMSDPRWNDPRFCGFPVQRNADGSIHRSTTVLTHFKAVWPCPDGTKTCPGWALDHTIPLVCGGCDSQANLQWMKQTIKSCAGADCKDRWEQRVYCR